MRIVSLLIAACLLVVSADAQTRYLVSSLGDEPDADITDEVYAPQTLRSAIQNAARNGGHAIIEISSVINEGTIVLTGPLPPIVNRCDFVGKGITINGNGASVGLTFNENADNSSLVDIFLTNFDGPGLAIRCDSSRFEAIESFNNRGPGVLLNDADNNTFTQKEDGATYAGLVLYNNSGSAGSGMQIDKDSDDNIVEFGFFGLTRGGSAGGNDVDGLLIGGHGNLIRECSFAYNGAAGIKFDQEERPGRTTLIRNCLFQLGLDFSDINQIDTIVPEDQEKGIFGLRAFNIRIDSCTFGTHRSDAIDMAGTATAGISIAHNRVGVLPGPPMEPLVNGRTGIRVGGELIAVDSNVVAGSSTGISGQGEDIMIRSNQIGVAVNDTTAFGTRNFGILLGACVDCSVGDSADPTLGNTVIATGRDGIGATTTTPIVDAVIAHNYLGRVRGTTNSYPVGGFGVSLTGEIDGAMISKNVVHGKSGGVSVSRRIVVRQNGPVFFTPKNVEIQGNDFGSIDSKVDTINGVAGIRITEASAKIDSNIVVFGKYGLVISTDSTTSVEATRNVFGREQTNPDTSAHLELDGVLIENGPMNVSIGILDDNTSGNSIIGNGRYAINAMGSFTMATFAHNTICENQEGGIALEDIDSYYADGHSDDNLDEDSGTNGLQNTVRSSSFNVSGNTVRYSGELRSMPEERYHVQSFVASAPSEAISSQIQGCTAIEQFFVDANEAGIARFEREIEDQTTAELLADGVITYLVTSSEGATSQFSISGSTEAIDLVCEYNDVRSGEFEAGIVTTLVNVWNESGTTVANVTISDTLPSGFSIDTLIATNGNSEVVDGVVLTNADQLIAGDTVSVYIVGRVGTPGRHTRVTSAEVPGAPDPRDNNIDTFEVDIQTVSSVESHRQTSLVVRGITRAIQIADADEPVWVTILDLSGRVLVQNVAVKAEESLSVAVPPGIVAVTARTASGDVMRCIRIANP